MNLSSWMGSLDDRLKNVPIINLAIPGSHDSMSYSITPSSSVAPDNERIVQILAKIFGKPSRRVIYRWCITQELTVLQQLHFGIRYLDLRLSTRESDSKLYFVHGLYGEEISTNLKKINEFLDKFPDEVVILDCQHFYDFGPEDHGTLKEMLKAIFSNKLCPLPWDITTVTLSWMVGRGYRVIIIYRHKSSEEDDRFWPGVRWPTPWPQTTSIETMLHFLSKTLSHRAKNAGFVTQCVLTPDVKFVVRNPCGALQSSCAVPCFRAVIPWLQQQRPGLHGVNVVITDFVNTEAELFSTVVIGLNDLLLKS
uniref:Phosphatidylinositol-specific phospholipase C X domain-containing protein n=1 Tax=Homalodisca liturata TaxID=320908 RepID=A0A1B6J506_9HEMI